MDNLNERNALLPIFRPIWQYILADKKLIIYLRMNAFKFIS